MKIILGSTFAVLTILVSAYSATSLPSIIADDIIIKIENGTIYCDTFICPPGALACHVTKRNNPQDFSKLVRNRKCFAVNGAITAQETIHEPNKYKEDVNITIVSGGGDPSIVPPLRPEEQIELEEYHI